MKKLFSTILIIAALVSLQSCLFEQDDIFDETPSARVQERMSALKEVLDDQQYGWVMDMFPGEGQPYGGYSFTLKFHADSVDVQCELATDIDQVLTSLYKTTTDDGATLSFDTYNEYFHYFSTPSSSYYTAFDGEFEFLIIDVSKDLVKLKGAKTGNIFYLRPLEEPASQYLKEVVAMDKYLQSWLPTFGDSKTTAEVHTFQRYAIITDVATGESEQKSLCVTNNGIRFYDEIEFENVSADNFSIVKEGNSFRGFKTDDGQQISWIKPEGWEDYDSMDLENHTWTLNCQVAMSDETLKEVKIPVTLSRYTKGDEKGYAVQGLWSDDKPLLLRYAEREGKIEFVAYLYAETSDTKYPYMYICPARRSYYTELGITSFYLAAYYENQGMMFASDGKGSYDYVNNKVYPDYTYDCLCTKVFDEDLYNFQYVAGSDWYFPAADPALKNSYGCFLYSITKLEKVK